MASTFLRFVSVLLLLPASLRDYYLPAASNRRTAAANDAMDDELHPMVLVPGGSCSELEARLTDEYRPRVPRCGAMKGKGWFGLWQNSSDLVAHDYVACFVEQMSLVYDPDANDYRNIAGVETRVPNFGTCTGFYRNPDHPEWCLEPLRQELQRIGYRDGATLFGAPYDLRYVPPIPGQPSRVFSIYFRQLAALIENATTNQQHKKKKVILLGHSMGGLVALEFVRAMPIAWRDRYIKHLLLVAPLPAAGIVAPVWKFVSGNSWFLSPTATVLSMRPMWRSFEAAIVGFPSAALLRDDDDDDNPVVITKRRNYTARDMENLLVDAGAGDAVEPFRRRQLPRSSYFQAPMVPVTCINGVGNETPEQLVYWKADFDKDPEIVYGDGDEDINLASMLWFDDEMRRHPGQRDRYKSIKLHGASHSTIVTADRSLKRVMQEILEANRI